MTLSETITKYKDQLVKFSIFLGILLLGAILYIVASLSNDNTPPLISLPKQAVASPTPTPIRAEMSIQPSAVAVKIGERFTVDIVADAHTTVINGIDSVIMYDPSMVRVIRINPPEKPDPSFSLARKQTEDNKILLSSIKTHYTAVPSQEFTVARIIFQPLKTGETRLSFEHNPGTTTGSTIIKAEGSENILDKVTETTIVIK